MDKVDCGYSADCFSFELLRFLGKPHRFLSQMFAEGNEDRIAFIFYSRFVEQIIVLAE
jgi:hypothetical protein